MQIGEKIRDLRKEKGMTLRDLAEKVNITSGYISQIERDQIDPSFSVLRRIASTLEVSLASLLSEETQGGVVAIPKEKRTKIKFADINMEYEFLTPTGRPGGVMPNMEVIYLKLAPKTWGSSDDMIHAADECTFVLKGKMEQHVNGSVYLIEEGGSLYVPKNLPHRLYNPTDEEVELIGIISPPVY